MKKKLITIISTFLAVVFGVSMFSGCDLLETDNKKDMEQVVAEVNIGKDADSLNSMFKTIFGADYALDEGVAGKLGDIVTTDNVYKRDLVAYFVNYGYNYVNSYGYSYTETFELLMESLVSRKIMVQYAALYYLSEGQVVVDRDSLSPDVLKAVDAAPDGSNEYGYKVVTGTDGIIVKDGLTVDGYLAVKDQDGLSGDAQVIASLGYFLTEDEKNYAEYQLRLSINSAIDSYEKEIVTAEEEETSSSDSDRTTPTGSNTLDENYYPKKDDGSLDYQIYTGSNYTEDLGEYEKVDGSTPISRKKAYNKFIESLSRNYLKDDSESPSDITKLSYYSIELKTQYEQILINKFSDTLALNMSAQRENEDLQRRYNLMYDSQKATADAGTSSDFTTTMDSMSDSSFVLYSPSAGYGFVYNILLPFNSSESAYLTAFKNSNTTAAYYAERNKMLEKITATDQRSSWFNGAEDYSFDADEAGVDYFGKTDSSAPSSYLFFEDSFTKGDGIDRYAGKFPYQGSVTKEDDGTYTLVPEKITVEGFLDTMEAYMQYLDSKQTLTGSYTSGFFGKDESDFIATSDDFEYDYSQMIYYKGQLGKVSGNDSLLDKNGSSYKSISAFNELMFAYSTDTGCLNTYLGYSIAAEGFSTSYVPEFEYAVQEAVKKGAGSIYVVGTDYGWHIIYVTMQLPKGSVYGGFNYDERTTEGTFSYYFYQTLKDEVSSSYTTDMQNRVIELLNNDSNVKLFKSRYKDLTNLG